MWPMLPLLCTTLGSLLICACASSHGKGSPPEYAVRYEDRRVVDGFLSIRATVTGSWSGDSFLGVTVPSHVAGQLARESTFRVSIQDCSGKIVCSGVHPTLQNTLGKVELWNGRGFILPSSAGLCFPVRMDVDVGPLDSWGAETAGSASLSIYTPRP